MRIMMMTFALIISALCSVLLAWAGETYFDVAFMPAFALSLLLLFFLCAREMINSTIYNTDHAGTEISDKSIEGRAAVTSSQELSHESRHDRFGRIFLRGMLFGAMVFTTGAAAVILRVPFQLLTERSTIVGDAMIAGALSIVFGIFVAAILDAIVGWE